MPPFYANVPAIGLPFGTVIAPGGRIAAYVRSTAKNDDPPFIQENRVASINEACKRVRSGRPDVIIVLDGHTETHSVTGAIWPNLKAGTVILGCGRPGSSNAPRVTLAHAGASVALNVADVIVIGLDIRSSTATLTAALAFTAAGCGLFRSRVALAGALGANPPVAVTGAPQVSIEDNEFIVDSTDPIIEVTNAATKDLNIHRNRIRQTQGTSGGIGIDVANAAITGFCSFNHILTASALGAGAIGSLITVGAAALPGFGVFENRGSDSAGNSGIVVPDANADG